MKLSCILEVIEALAPLDLQLPYDNSGLIVGERGLEVKGILICIDVTRQAVVEAIESGCNLIVSHHPLIFEGLKKIVAGEAKNDIIITAIKNNIAIYASHTNFDACNGGLSESFARTVGIAKSNLLYANGIGRYGEFEKVETLCSLAKNLEKSIGESKIKVFGFADKTLKRAAVVNGAGGRDSELCNMLMNLEVDVFVSSEFKHSLVVELTDNGIAVIDVGHYSSEREFLTLCEKLLRKHFQTIKIELFESEIFNT